MKEKIVRKKTLHGGDYSKIVFLDEDNNVVDESVATRCAVIEFKDDGTQVYETFGVFADRLYKLMRNKKNMSRV